MGLGGVVQDHEGDVLLVMSKALDISGIVAVAEAMALRKDLNIACDVGMFSLTIF